MPSIPEDKKERIISLLLDGVDRKTIAEELEVNPRSVSAIKAHMTMGSYESTQIEEVVDALETTFGLEKDLQEALRNNIEQLEPGLKIIDDGKETTTYAGRIDIMAEDAMGDVIIIELKAGKAPLDSITQILSYISSVSLPNNDSVRGILIAGDFPERVVQAVRVVPNLELKKYGFKFIFEDVQ